MKSILWMKQFFLFIIIAFSVAPAWLSADSTVISVYDASINEPDSGTANMNFTVELGATQTTPTKFVCHTTYGTADSSDFNAIPANTEYTIPANTQQYTVSVPIIGDLNSETTPKTFTLTLDSVSAAYISIDRKTATGTINDLDNRSLAIDSQSVNEGNSKNLTVTLSGNTATTSIPFTITLGGDATAGTDYTAPTLSGSIASGATSTTITIPTTADTQVEYDENVTVTIATTSGVPITTNKGTLTITNNDNYVFEIDPLSKSVGEGDGTVSLLIKINQTPLSGQSSWVKWKTKNSSTTPNATSGSDYTAISPTQVTFNPGDLNKTISVTINDDLLNDGDEYFDAYLDSKKSNASWKSTAARTSTIKIIDNDSSSLSIDDINVSEGVGNANITVRLNGPLLGTAATFQYSTGTYPAGAGNADSSDFTARSSVNGSIAAGSDSTTITVPITNDSAIEPFEKFKVVLSNANISISDDTADVGINDNDTYTVSLSTPTDVIESATTQRFTASISPTPLSGDSVTLNYTTNGTPTAGTTATAGSDFTTKTGSITFNPTTTSVDIDVSILGDNTAENDETYFLELNTLSTNAVFQGGNPTLSKSGKIIDDDNRSLSINDVNVTEGSTISLTVTMSGNTSSLATPFTISLGGTATSGSDYTAPTLTGSIAAGSSTATISIPTTNDTRIEGFEYIDVTITSTAAAIGDGTGRGGITDNDNYILSISPANTNHNTNEGNSGTNTNVPYTVTINQTPVAGDSVTVDYAFAGYGTDQATIGTSQSAGVDVNVSATSGTLTFTPGQTTKTIYATVIGDNTEENYEQYRVTLSNESANADINGSAIYSQETIQNDDTSLRILDREVTEGACDNTAVRMIAQLSKPVNFQVNVPYSTRASTPLSAEAGSGKDYTATTNTLRILAGNINSEDEAAAYIPILLDSAVESDETFDVNITNTQPGVSVIDNLAVVTIHDNQTNDLTTFNDVSTYEGDSLQHNLDFTVTLCKNAASNVNITYRTNDGIGASGAVDAGTGSSGGNDFDGTSSSYVTIAAGSRSQTISIPINGDLFDENDETFTVTLTGATGGVNLTDYNATGTILDDDNRRLYINDVSVVEGNTIGNNTTATMRISLVDKNNINNLYKASTDVSVTYTTADDSAKTSNSDYTPATRTVTIPAAVGYVDIDLNVTQDTTAEATERFFVNLSAVTPGVQYYNDDSQGIVTIIDDDNRTVTLRGINVSEGDSGFKDVNVTIELNATSPVARSGTYYTQFVVGSADNTDFEPITIPVTWNIVANEKNVTVPVRIYGNMVSENDEDFNVLITTNDGFAISGSPATVRIVNDDYLLSVSDVTLIEGDSGQKDFNFNINLSGPMKTAVTVNYTTESSPGTASSSSDYDPVTSSVTFAIDDNVTKTVTVKVNGDTLPESDENFFFTITNAQSVSISKATGTGTIRDDDNRTVSVVSQAFDEGEGNVSRSIQVCIDTPRLFDDLDISYQTVDTGSAIGGVDYNTTSGTVTIRHGNACEDVNVTFMGDYTYEPNETFNFRVLSASPALGITLPTSDTTITILNDDGNLSVVPTAEVYESNTSETASMIFTIALNKKMNSPVTVYYSTIDGTAKAVADNDYVPLVSSVTFAAGEFEKSISVTVIGDKKIEGNEVFDFNISNNQGVTITNPISTGTILEDDGRAISVQDINVDEGDIGTFTSYVPITINLDSETPIMIDYNVTSTDANASDFVASSGTITLEANQTSVPIPITHYGDLTYEGSEKIVVQISTSTSGVSVARAEGYLTLLNDDGVLQIGDSTITENNSTFPVYGDINVTLTRASTQPIVIHYTMIDDTALNGSDYEAFDGNVTIPAGELNASIPLKILFDVTPEVNEYFRVHITNDQNVTIQDGDGNVTIVDDELNQMTIIDRQREFGLIKGINIYGNYVATGAPIMCVLNDDNTTCNWSYDGLLSTGNTKFLHDNDVALGTTNSSAAELDIPFNKDLGDTIVWAGLYWQGHIEGNVPSALDSNKTGFNQVVFGTPNGAKRTITADEYDLNQTNYYGYYTGTTATAKPGFRFFYQGFADVTSDVNTSLINNNGRRFSVGGIKATEGPDKLINNPNLNNGNGYGLVGHFGGWSLVVIYRKADATALPEDLHNVSIYNGYKYIASKNTEPIKELNISVSGFRTPSSLAANTTIDSKLLYFGGGSERKMTGDSMKISNKAGDFNATHDANNDANNTLNDTISILGSDLNSTRDYNPGIDMDMIQVGELLDKNQSSTTIKISTLYTGGGTDQAFAGLVGLSTQLHQPQLCYDFSYQQNGQYLKKAISSNELPTISGYVLDNKDITAGIYLKNTDSDFSIRGISIFSDMNGSKVSYVSPSTQITRVNGVAYQGIESEHPGTCDYSGGSTDIACSDGTDVRIGVGNNVTGYTKSAAGSLNSGDFVFAQFKVDPHNLSGDVNESLGLQVDHCIDFENLETGVPQELCITGILGKTIPLCSEDTTSTYNPAWGTFNIVDTNSNPTTTTKNNLYTQIAKKPFDVSLAVYDKGVDGSYNHLPTVDVNTTVMVEVIDAGAYQDVNTSCANPDANMTVPVFVEINATAAHNTQSILAQIVENPDDYNVAVRNAAFRIWWFDDGSGDQTTLAQNWRVSTADSTRKDSASSYSTDLYNPVTHNTKCGGDCGTPTSSACFACLKKYYVHPVCSRDNFAIRPEGFKVDLKDKSTTITTPIKVAAGYDYNLSVTATNHLDEANVIGYTPGYGVASGSYVYTSSMDWNSVKTTPDCTTDANVSLETVLKTMYNGYLDYNLSHGNVGEYLTNLIDDSWTATDQVTSNAYRTASNGFDTTKDCLVGNANTTGTTNTIGCRITTSEESTGYTFDAAKRAFRFYPHHYDMTSMKFTKGLKFNEVNATTTKNFIYMADMNDSNSTSMSLRLNGNIVALGDDNSTLSNFKAGCYAQDINLSMSMTASLANLQGCVIRNGESNCSSTIASIASFNNMFASATHGTVSEGNFTGAGSSAPVTIYLNYDRNITTPINPLNVTVGSVNTIDAAGTKIAANENASQDITGSYNPDDFNVRFYYGRAQGVDSRVRTADQNTTTAQGNVRVNFEIYCSSDGRSWCNDPTLLALLPNAANTPHGEDRGWIKNIWQFGYEENNASDRNYGLADLNGVIERKSGDGNVTVNLTKQAVSGNIITPSEVGFKSYGVTYDGKKGYPHTVIMINEPDPWLVYDPKNTNSGHLNEFTIEFYKPSTWVGESKTNTSTDSDISVNPSRRIMW